MPRGIGSSSTTAPLPNPTPAPTPPSKITVRAKPPLLTAVRLASDSRVRLADGRDVQATAGMWLVNNGRITVDVLAQPQLTERYQIVDQGERRLSAADCARLEQTTGVGSTRTPADLCAAVERLARITIGTVQVDFTPGQLEEIASRAKKRGQTVQQALQAVIDRIREELFWRS